MVFEAQMLNSVRQHIAYMLSALYAIERQSVCPSVCPSDGCIIEK